MLRKCFFILVTTLLLGGLFVNGGFVKAAEESVYDLVVDRFYNQNENNDARHHKTFKGGDFEGIEAHIEHFKKLGFTTLSLGSIFQADDFEGQAVLDYTALQQHFGTEKDYFSLIDTLHKENFKVMADFPLNDVSSDHKWISKRLNWAEVQGDKATWNFENPAVVDALGEAAIDFIKKYKVDALRLTALENVPKNVQETIVERIKQQSQVLLMTNTIGKADWVLDEETVAIYKDIFKATNEDSSKLEQPLQQKEGILQIDSIGEQRFTYAAAQQNMFPPTRIKLAMTTLLTLPGVPIMTYGTEIAQNGRSKEASLAMMDFHTKEDLIEAIGDVQAVRNQSLALQKGDFELLENQNGFIVYKRQYEDDRLLVVINNTNEKQSLTLSTEALGNEELRGILDGETIRAKDGEVSIIQNRETAEIYQIKENIGLNMPYLIALGFVYIIFISFIILLLRRGKKTVS